MAKKAMSNTSSFVENYRKRLGYYHTGLAEDLNLIIGLDTSTQNSILKYLLELACESQNIRNISLGRQALWSIERKWLISRIEDAAEPLIQLGNEWEYRRLIELYWHIDALLVSRLAQRGQNHKNQEIHFTALECIEKLLRLGVEERQSAPNREYSEY